MTWTEIARKDFEDAVRSRTVWAIVAAFVAVGLLRTVAVPADLDGAAALAAVATDAQLFVPLVALIAGYTAVVGERRSGSLRMLLAYPHTRADVVAGKVVGRSGVIAVGFAVGLGATVLATGVAAGLPPAGTLVAFVGVASLYGVAFTGVAVGISAGTSTRTRAMAVAMGFFLGCLIFWDVVAALAYTHVTGTHPGATAEPWYRLLRRLNPMAAYVHLADAAVSDATVAPLLRISVGDSAASAAGTGTADGAAGSLPFYLTARASALVLALWAAVPSVLGYARFRSIDLT